MFIMFLLTILIPIVSQIEQLRCNVFLSRLAVETAKKMHEK